MIVSSSKYKKIRRNEITGTLGSKLLTDANASYVKCFKWKLLSDKFTLLQQNYILITILPFSRWLEADSWNYNMIHEIY